MPGFSTETCTGVTRLVFLPSRNTAAPAGSMLTVCWPGANPGRLNGVPQLGSVRPSIRIVAPSGVELIVNCPGATVGAAGIIVFCLRLLACLVVTETLDGSAEISSGPAATAAGASDACDLADAAGCAGFGCAAGSVAPKCEELLSEFCK